MTIEVLKQSAAKEKKSGLTNVFGTPDDILDQAREKIGDMEGRGKPVNKVMIFLVHADEDGFTQEIVASPNIDDRDTTTMGALLMHQSAANLIREFDE